MDIAIALVVSYFLGAIPVGYLVGRMKGVDIRALGSGNIGTTNVMRALGTGPAIVVFVGDTVKGLFAVLIAHKLGVSPIFILLAGLISIVGHSASVFLKFKGGKGVATSLGVIIGLDPVVAGIVFVMWILLVAVTRYVSIASMLAAISVPILMLFSGKLHGKQDPTAYIIFAAAAALLIIVRHRSNIKRLLEGKEPRFGQRIKTG